MGAFFFKFCSLLRKYELKFILLRVCYFWSCHCRICVLPHEIEIEGQHQFIVAKTWWCSKPRGQNVEYMLSAQNLLIQTQSCAAVGLKKILHNEAMVFCYQNCSDLLWEKNVLVIEKNFWNLRLKAENLQNFWDH